MTIQVNSYSNPKNNEREEMKLKTWRIMKESKHLRRFINGNTPGGI